MAKVLVTESYLSAIGDAIRSKNLSEVTYTPAEMAQAILDIPGGGVSSGNEDAFITGTFIGPYINDRVTEINTPLFKENYNIPAVSFPNVTTIADEVFKESGVQTIHFPSLKTIGNSVFENCDYLANIELANLETIGTKSFYDCDNIVNVNLYNLNTINDSAFESCDNLLTVDTQNLKTIGVAAFKDCSKLINALMPNATDIGANAFQNCSSLNNIEMPNVTTIGDNAFDACSALTEANFPKVTTVGVEAFLNSGITSISMPKLTNSDDTAESAFWVCKSLKSVDIPNLTKISNSMFCGCSVLENVSFPLATGMLGYDAFNYCVKLKTVSLPNIESIGQRCFYNCNELESVYLPKITIIPQGAFKQAFAGGLTEKFTLNLGEMMPSVTTIHSLAFERSYITHLISTGRKRIYIYENAFQDSEYLKLVDFRHTVYLEDYAFDQCDNILAAVFREGFEGKTTTIADGRVLFNAFHTNGGVMSEIEAGYGYIYVPKSMLDDNGRYKGITNVIFRAIEDYTVDGTLDGELDLVKMGLEAN